MASRTPALSYLRVSGKGQTNGDGPQRQRDAIAKYAAAHGFEVIEELQDFGVSGRTEAKDRPGLAAVLARIDSDPAVRVVLVERADRLARDLMVSEVILGRFLKAGAQVIDARGEVLTASPEDATRTMVRQVLGVIAQFEKTVTVQKLRASRERIRARGERCEGRKPYGTRPGEQDTLDRMRKLHRLDRYGDRGSYQRVADLLNAEGSTTRLGRPWTKSAVYHVLIRARKRSHHLAVRNRRMNEEVRVIAASTASPSTPAKGKR